MSAPSVLCEVKIQRNRHQSFFHPRQIEITLAQGGERYCGIEGTPPPDTTRSLGKQVLVRHGSMSDEDQSDGEHVERYGRREAKCERKQMRRQHKMEKKIAKENRKQEKRTGQHAQVEPWRLIVSYREPIL